MSVHKNERVAKAAIKELDKAEQKYPTFKNNQEAIDTIKEESEELIEALKNNDQENIKEEAAQVAAMGMRVLKDLTDV